MIPQNQPLKKTDFSVYFTIGNNSLLFTGALFVKPYCVLIMADATALLMKRRSLRMPAAVCSLCKHKSAVLRHTCEL